MWEKQKWDIHPSAHRFIQHVSTSTFWKNGGNQMSQLKFLDKRRLPVAPAPLNFRIAVMEDLIDQQGHLDAQNIWGIWACMPSDGFEIVRKFTRGEALTSVTNLLAPRDPVRTGKGGGHDAVARWALGPRTGRRPRWRRVSQGDRSPGRRDSCGLGADFCDCGRVCEELYLQPLVVYCTVALAPVLICWVHNGKNSLEFVQSFHS